ncbi:MAG: hypothetical protein AB1806_16840 [Acidobacteriota bacterium]
MLSSCGSRAWRPALALVTLLAGSGTLSGAAFAASDSPPGALAFRLFLKDGTPIVTLGECTRAGGRVVFTLPVGLSDGPSPGQLVSLPDHVIDWDRTTRYADAVRAKRYADTRGEAEFAALTSEVAQALADVAASLGPARRLAVAERLRSRVVEWPRRHYGYRAADVRELVFLVDETITGIRADLGEQSFTIDLVATTEAPSEPILPEPTPQESIEQAMAVARLSDVPAERVPLQQAILSVLAPKRRDLPRAWAAARRTAVEALLRADQRADRRYSRLVQSALDEAVSRAGRGDAEGIGRLLDKVRREDEKLGRERPGQMAALVATLESYSRLAQRRRLALQLSARRLEEHAAYRRGTLTVFRGVRQMERDMTAIRGLGSPGQRRLTQISKALDTHATSLLGLAAPSELLAAHENLLTSIRLMQEATRLRRQAVGTRNAEAARNASAAAAGAQLLLTRARAAIGDFFEVPRTR